MRIVVVIFLDLSYSQCIYNGCIVSKLTTKNNGEIGKSHRHFRSTDTGILPHEFQHRLVYRDIYRDICWHALCTNRLQNALRHEVDERPAIHLGRPNSPSCPMTRTQDNGHR